MPPRRSRPALFSAICLCVSAPSLAGETTFRGDTTGGPLWHRPDAAGGLGDFGKRVPYEAITIRVSEDGAYDLLSDQTTPRAPWDGYLLVYEAGFDPAFPFAGLIAINDDYFGSLLPGVGVGYSGVEGLHLRAGVAYVVVTTGFNDDDSGAHQLRVAGPGTIIDGSCLADFNADGQLDLADLLAFQAAFDAGGPLADCDADGAHTLFDLLCFLRQFDAGCE